jgi:hypothetical protein
MQILPLIDPYRLFMVLVGCLPQGRYTEQHDIFFGIGNQPKDLIPALNAFWPEAKGRLHIDAWREVNQVDGFSIEVQSLEKQKDSALDFENRLFFINLGGYKINEFDEFHYKMLTVAKDKGQAIQQAKQTAFYKHIGFKGAESHIDDKFGVDVDDIYEIADILNREYKDKFTLQIEPADLYKEDEIHLGYFNLHNQ